MVGSDMEAMLAPKPFKNYFYMKFILLLVEENEAVFTDAFTSSQAILVVDVLFAADIIFFSLL